MSVQSDYVLIERAENYEVTLERMSAMLAELSAACEETGCRKVLIVGPKTTVNLQTVDIYDLGAQIAALHLTIAIAESHNAAKDDESFLETVVFNRGGPLRFFTNEQDARDWLENS
jgi:hypothetical protein